MSSNKAGPYKASSPTKPGLDGSLVCINFISPPARLVLIASRRFLDPSVRIHSASILLESSRVAISLRRRKNSENIEAVTKNITTIAIPATAPLVGPVFPGIDEEAGSGVQRHNIISPQARLQVSAQVSVDPTIQSSLTNSRLPSSGVFGPGACARNHLPFPVCQFTPTKELHSVYLINRLRRSTNFDCNNCLWGDFGVHRRG